ncbi:relaxase/mobilization nuclease domain-containing protein [Pseudonocardia xishanensis]|uniref:Relaxase/mobilization nuclease domain-containing protein n=1 Tax=Pseudonocardia xishanensis TaxID=630995 RepID=A0ABP8RZW0_9PSEU
MIAKISRGWRVGGLVRYLMGPGRFNEHTNQHVIASWDGAPAMHQPSLLPSGEFDVSDLSDELADPALAAGIPQTEPVREEGRRVPRGPVWHCSLRNSADDRPLTDEEWAEVVEELMERTGIATAGDLGACRWVAIRHADDHVHIAAMLVRQDNGRKVHPRNDFLRAREVCRDAEERLGLTRTAAIDRTTAEPATRAEMEKAARRGDSETSREWLRRAARVAAVQAQDPEDFFRRLADLGAVVRPKELPPGQLVGYAVAAPGDETLEGLPVWYSGRRLARDLALPQLLRRWASATPQATIAPAAGERSQVGRAERDAAVTEAISAVEHATATIAAGGRDAVPSVAHAAGDMLSAVCAVTERGRGVAPVPWSAADVFDRAARTPGQGQPNRWAPVASQLRSAAWRLVAVRAVTGKNGDSGVGQLVLALASLAAEIAAFREQERCVAQAGAARRSAHLLRQPRAARPAGAAGTHPQQGSRGTGRRSMTAEPVAPRTQDKTSVEDVNGSRGRRR